MKLCKTHVRKTARRDVYVCVELHVYVHVHVHVYVYVYVGSSPLLEPHTMGWGGGVGC